MRRLISLTKPGIIFGNLVTFFGGFFLAVQSSDNFSLLTLLCSAVGISLVIASGCVFNNIIDRDIDAVMKRTQDRVMPQGEMSVLVAFLYGVLLFVLGFGALALFVNWWAFSLAAFGFVVYVGVYSLWFKRHSDLGTILGGFSGSVPPMIGYATVSNAWNIDMQWLFFMLFFWQLPHFYAIAINRLDDYSAANIPVLPKVKGILHTKWASMVFMVLFTISAFCLYLFGSASMLYGIVALAMGCYWFYLGVREFNNPDDRVWAKKVFFFSILTITVLSIAMAL